MRIGIDLDNTLINYHGVFHKAAVALNWLPKSVGSSKSDVKQFLQQEKGADAWTELQGIVYGETIEHALPFVNASKVLKEWKAKGYQLFLVSHKTRYPVIGEKRDFHLAANAWLEAQGFKEFFRERFFCPTLNAKVAQVAILQVDVFVDDLSSVLLHSQFPDEVFKILFASKSESPKLSSAMTWQDVANLVEDYAA